MKTTIELIDKEELQQHYNNLTATINDVLGYAPRYDKYIGYTIFDLLVGEKATKRQIKDICLITFGTDFPGIEWALDNRKVVPLF